MCYALQSDFGKHQNNGNVAVLRPAVRPARSREAAGAHSPPAPARSDIILFHSAHTHVQAVCSPRARAPAAPACAVFHPQH